MSYTREDIIKELTNKGYKAIPNDVYRNNVKSSGIVIGDNRTNPCIYVDDFIRRGYSLEETTNAIVNIYESNKSVDFDVDEILSRDWILEHTFIALQRESNEPLVKRESRFEGIEEYLYLKGSSYSIRLNYGLLERVDISIDEMWKRAMDNTFSNSEICIESIVEAIGLDDDFGFDDCPIYVVTNKDKIKGSVLIFSEEVIAFGKEKGAKYLLALPSSIHEFLIYVVRDELTYSELEDLKANLSSIICCVNDQEVDESERLGDKPYVIKM